MTFGYGTKSTASSIADGSMKRDLGGKRKPKKGKRPLKKGSATRMMDLIGKMK